MIANLTDLLSLTMRVLLRLNDKPIGGGYYNRAGPIKVHELLQWVWCSQSSGKRRCLHSTFCPREMLQNLST